MEQVLERTEEKMQKTLNALAYDFSMIRAGRANPKLLDKISVSYYGAQTPLQQVANISVPDARMILIQPWDRTLIKEINKAIMASDTGITPSDDGQSIRLVFPELTGERRKELVKDCRKKAENAKVAVRNIRREAMDEIKKMEKASEITEDDEKDLENKIQKATDKFIKEIDDETEKKAKEITTV
ncbi:MAG: ribosome recycling factor [Lachnospiraceae bacterium]|nr:ribosome recycling factor [Lachnospiraceae bacterium]